MKKKNYLGLCMRYSESCKLCPRNKKCEKELEKELLKIKRVSVKETHQSQ